MALPAQEEVILTADSLGAGADSVESSLRGDAEFAPPKGIMLQPAAEEPIGTPGGGGNYISWILSGLFIIFVIVCLRYRKNSRYFSILLHDIMEVKERHNAFDDTLRETSFLWLLNLLWCGSAGVLLYGMLYPPDGGTLIGSIDVTRMLICMGIATGFTLFQSLSYALVGNVFSNRARASVWFKGHLSTQGLEAILLFLVALVSLCVPGICATMLVVGGIVFIMAKILFIYKGFCIFFADFSYWVLFLYYLCSLEIVPIVLAYTGARSLCEIV